MTNPNDKILVQFAIWTAATAAKSSARQGKYIKGTTIKRTFATADIEEIATDSGLTKLTVQEIGKYSMEEYDDLHTEMCESIMRHAMKRNISLTYGIAAKIVNVYIKTISINLGKNEYPVLRYIHPPVDRRILTNIGAAFKNSPFWRKNSKKAWTKLSKDEYMDIINSMRKLPIVIKHGLPATEFYWNL